MMARRNLRTVCVVTGSRAEYGILRHLLFQIRKSKKLKLQLVVSAMHLLDEFGSTVEQIRRDGFAIDATVPLNPGDSKQSMAKAIGSGIIGLTDAFASLDPDLVLVLGDRFEALAAAIAAAYSGRVVVHVGGGDSPHAGYDEYSRHAITKISHLHFPFTEACAARIRQMGEDPQNVVVSGSPSIDSIQSLSLETREAVLRRYDLDPDGAVALVLYHPLSTSEQTAGAEMRQLLDAVADVDVQALIVFPNFDPGGRRIIAVIDEYVRADPRLKAVKNVPYADFLNLLHAADVMVGNSSSGILEAPSFKIPVVNVGSRQEGRERGGNVIDVPADRASIRRAIQTALHGEDFRRGLARCINPYGQGNASRTIVAALESVPLTPALLMKKFDDRALARS